LEGEKASNDMENPSVFMRDILRQAFDYKIMPAMRVLTKKNFFILKDILYQKVTGSFSAG